MNKRNVNRRSDALFNKVTGGIHNIAITYTAWTFTFGLSYMWQLIEKLPDINLWQTDDYLINSSSP